MTAKILTQSYMKESLDYDSETGVFTWKLRPLHHFKTQKSRNTTNTRFSNKAAGHLNDCGYIIIRIFGRSIRAHRLAWYWITGKFPAVGIDHIDQDRANNTWSNLREATHTVNARNMRLRNTNTSGVCGVHFFKRTGKWQASIRVSMKSIHLGMFSKKKDAIDARKAAEKKYGFHKNHGNKPIIVNRENL